MLEPDEQLRPYCRDTAAAMSVACCLARASHGAGGKSVSPRGSTLPVAEEASASSARSLRRRSTVATTSGRPIADSEPD